MLMTTDRHLSQPVKTQNGAAPGSMNTLLFVTPALILSRLEGVLRGIHQEPDPLLSIWQLQTHLISAITLNWKPI